MSEPGHAVVAPDRLTSAPGVAVDLGALVRHVEPLVEWERAFAAVRAAEVVELVLDPRRALSSAARSRR